MAERTQATADVHHEPADSSGTPLTGTSDAVRRDRGERRLRRGHRSLWRMAATRLVALPASLFVLATICFFLVSLMPGDPAVTIAGQNAAPEDIEAVRSRLGMDRSLWDQYTSYLGSILRGDLGQSYYSNQSVAEELFRRLPATLELIVLALALASVVGFGIGAFAAYHRGRPLDGAARTAVTVVQSIPDFVLALFFIYVGFYLLGIAAAPTGRLPIGETGFEPITGFVLIDGLLLGDAHILNSGIARLTLPVLTLGIVYSAYFAKTTRAALSAGLASRQVEFARACGLPERQVLRYAWLQGRPPIITYFAVLLGFLIGGAAIIETIFAWQGAGQWALQGILNKDVPIIQGFVLLTGTITIVIYLGLDLLLNAIDPRTKK
ncbi:ABC transporter permease [Phytohabitans kaempferiae]|uniref:ABC transporter permease n=1 Tax=Phytohabitans kaempferiae TaxID=1620943 RepID=A0ABV6M3C8_9ACTN